MEIKNHNTLSYYNFKDIISKHIHTQMGKSNIHEIPVGKSNLFLIKKKKKIFGKYFWGARRILEDNTLKMIVERNRELKL